MSIKNYYIFRSGEIFLTCSHTVPTSIPEDFSPVIVDSYDLLLSGTPSCAVLLKDNRTRQEIGSASISDTSNNADSGERRLGRWVKLRELMAEIETTKVELASSATKALGYINWHHSHRFCSRCGTALSDHLTENARICPSCGISVFPRLSPAIIVLVQKEGKILLARHAERNQDVFSCIAGYVEHGESLEECVSREVFEETGLKIHNIRYAGSQSWPYPDQYMIAFYADWKSGEICVDPKEILEARWFDRDSLPNYPMPGTVAWRLINGVLGVLAKK